MDKIIITDNLTGETKEIEVEHERTVQTTEQKKQAILFELSELDRIISRVEEDILQSINLTLHSSKQAIIDRKIALQLELNSIT